MSDGTQDGHQEHPFLRLKNAAKRMLEEIRPWAEFVGPVSFPRIRGQKPELGSRLELNLSFFKMNYILIMLVCCIFQIITKPGLACIILLFSSLYFLLVLFRARKSPIIVGEFILRAKEQLIIISALFILVLGLTGYILKIRIPLLIGGSVCLLHAVFRPPVSRAVASRDGEKSTLLNASLEDLEGGPSSSYLLEQPNSTQDLLDLPANANIRLRSRPLPNAKYIPGPYRPVPERTDGRNS